MVKFKVDAVRGTQGRKEAQINVDGLELGVAVVSGLQNAKDLLAEVKAGKKNIHFIENIIRSKSYEFQING